MWPCPYLNSPITIFIAAYNNNNKEKREKKLCIFIYYNSKISHCLSRHCTAFLPLDMKKMNPPSFATEIMAFMSTLSEIKDLTGYSNWIPRLFPLFGAWRKLIFFWGYFFSQVIVYGKYAVWIVVHCSTTCFASYWLLLWWQLGTKTFLQVTLPFIFISLSNATVDVVTIYY